MTGLPLSIGESLDLVARTRDGDDGAFTALVSMYQARVFRWALALTGDQDEAEDVTHVHSALREAFEMLTDHEKLVLRRVVLDGRRPKEVGLEIGIGANAVSACKLRALRKMRVSFIGQLRGRLSEDQRDDLHEIVGDFRHSA